MIDTIAALLQRQIDEAHFIQAALNNLELVKLAQDEQKEWGWSRFTEQAIHDYKTRLTVLHKGIARLTARQKELNNATV
jgi:hypothetical protein